MTPRQPRWTPTDPRHFEGKTAAELQRMLNDALAFTARHPQFEFGWHNEYTQELKRRVAQCIGVKTKE